MDTVTSPILVQIITACDYVGYAGSRDTIQHDAITISRDTFRGADFPQRGTYPDTFLTRS